MFLIAIKQIKGVKKLKIIINLIKYLISFKIPSYLVFYNTCLKRNRNIANRFLFFKKISNIFSRKRLASVTIMGMKIEKAHLVKSYILAE